MTIHDEEKIDHEEVVHNVSDEEVNDNNEDMENMKERVALAESETDSIRRKNEILESQVAELKIQLESSLENQRKFMVAGDKSTEAMDAMNEDVATKVASILDPKLDSLKTVTGNISLALKISSSTEGKTGSVLDDILTKQGMSQIEETRGVSVSSINEGLVNIKDILACYGLDESADATSIPALLSQILSAVQQIPSYNQPQAPSSNGRPCFFQARGLPGVFVCTCGCGIELQACASPQPQSGASSLPLNVSGYSSHQATDPAKVTYTNVNPGFTSKAVDDPNLSKDGGSVRGLTRKEKRAIKNKEFLEKKRARFNLDNKRSYSKGYYQPATFDYRLSSANNNQVTHGLQPSHASFATQGVQSQIQHDFRQPPVPLGQYGQHSAMTPPARPLPSVWMDNRFNDTPS